MALMKFLDLSLDTPSENLALDEALLDYCEEKGSLEILRIWEPKEYFVVLGYSNKINLEVNRAYCGRQGIPVYRRISGGGTVLQGPGCLNYALILKIGRDPDLKNITKTNSYIMKRNQEALEKLLQKGLAIQGDTDLTANNLKFSGNAQRRRQNYLLFHGTVLYGLDLEKIGETLNHPSRQPRYRKNRPHDLFVANLPLSKPDITSALQNIWNADEPFTDVPFNHVERLIMEKYQDPGFIEKF